MPIDAETYFLSCLGEEGVEVSQRVSKAIRFGLDEVQPGQKFTNRARIVMEYVDMLGAMEVLIERDILAVDLPEGFSVEAKKAKIYKYLEYAKSVGAVR